MAVYSVKLTALRLTTEADERPSETLELEWEGNRDGLEGVWYTLRVWADTATHEHPAEPGDKEKTE